MLLQAYQSFTSLIAFILLLVLTCGLLAPYATMIWANLTTPSHYLNQCSLLISAISSESDSITTAQDIIMYNVFKNYTFEIIPIPPAANKLMSSYTASAVAC